MQACKCSIVAQHVLNVSLGKQSAQHEEHNTQTIGDFVFFADLFNISP
jgi:hypothetical protein